MMKPIIWVCSTSKINSKADIESVLSDKYEVTADKAQPYQLHEALSSAIMKQIAPVWKDLASAQTCAR